MLCDKIGWARLELAESLGEDMSDLAEWESFYVIIGSSAGALIGLQFVVMTLIAEMPPLRVAQVGAAFAIRDGKRIGRSSEVSDSMTKPNCSRRVAGERALNSVRRKRNSRNDPLGQKINAKSSSKRPHNSPLKKLTTESPSLIANHRWAAPFSPCNCQLIR